MANAFTLPENVKLQPFVICIVSCAFAALAAPSTKPIHNSATRLIGTSPSRVRMTADDSQTSEQTLRLVHSCLPKAVYLKPADLDSHSPPGKRATWAGGRGPSTSSNR